MPHWSALDAVGGLERRIAAQPWLAVPGSWSVADEVQGWIFRLEPVPGGVRVVASAGGGGKPAVWTVPRPEAGR